MNSLGVEFLKNFFYLQNSNLKYYLKKGLFNLNYNYLEAKWASTDQIRARKAHWGGGEILRR